VKITADTITVSQIRKLRSAIRLEIEDLYGLVNTLSDALVVDTSARDLDRDSARERAAEIWNARHAKDGAE
jgi:hypothetical protein